MAQKSVAIVTDSSAFLPEVVREQYGIHMIPLNLHWGEESLLDGVEITTDEFYRRLAEADAVPTTSQPSAGRFLELFERVAEEADSIVGVFISSDLSGTFASANAAREMMADYPIEIVDSRSASLGLGLIAVAAARAVEEGKGFRQAAAAARTLAQHTRVLFVVDTLEYLHKGGRIGGAKRFLGSVLSIKPILHLVDGEIEPLGSVRTKRKAVDRMLTVVRDETAGAGPLHMAVISAAAPEEGDALCARVRREFDPASLIQGELSPVVGAHTGPGTVGIAFYDGALLGAEIA